MTRTACAASALALLMVCGCSFMEREPYHKTSYFEIIPDQSEMHPETGASALSVNSSIQFSDRMIFKDGEKLEFDEYNRWAASPEALLKRYFDLSLAPSANSKISAQMKVLRFDMDKPGQTASCEILLTVFKDSAALKSMRISSTVKAKGGTAHDFVDAMHSAVAEIAAKLADELKKANG